MSMTRLLVLAAIGSMALAAWSVGGTFAAKTGETRLRAQLVATAAGGAAERHADFRDAAGAKRFTVQVQNVTVDGRYEVVVKRGGAAILTTAVNVRHGLGERELKTGVPAIEPGDTVEVSGPAPGATLILAGAF